ncbi:unnamed protein product [Amoebophrya sp. A120]|nr:unnamed protein product [Amoebophrya sp. A120]|eukprot:GSA120T00023677001.1
MQACSSIIPTRPRTLVLLCNPRFPSNIGGVMRSCALLGADGLIIASEEESKLRPQAERVGMVKRCEYALKMKWISPNGVTTTAFGEYGGITTLLSRLKRRMDVRENKNGSSFLVDEAHLSQMEVGPDSGKGNSNSYHITAIEKEIPGFVQETRQSQKNMQETRLPETQTEAQTPRPFDDSCVTITAPRPWCDKNLPPLQARAFQPIDSLQQHGSHCFVFGAEDTGVPEEVLETCDSFAHIPQAREPHSSLNVAHTVSICLYERARWLRDSRAGVFGLREQNEEEGCIV